MNAPNRGPPRGLKVHCYLFLGLSLPPSPHPDAFCLLLHFPASLAIARHPPSLSLLSFLFFLLFLSLSHSLLPEVFLYSHLATFSSSNCCTLQPGRVRSSRNGGPQLNRNPNAVMVVHDWHVTKLCIHGGRTQFSDLPPTSQSGC